MAYLDRRCNGYRFQIAIPADMQHQFGQTPLRIYLGRVSAADARRAARLLSGYAETVFMAHRNRPADRTMTREALSESLAALAAEIDDIKKQDMRLRLQAANLAGGAREIEEDVAAPDFMKSEAAGMRAAEAAAARKRKDLAKIQARLERIGAGIAADKAALEKAKGRDENEPISLNALQTEVMRLSAQVQMSLDGGPTRPLMSTLLEDWIEIRSGLGIDPKTVKTEHNRIQDFIRFAGDRPVNKYAYFDFQRWANILARVPASASVKPKLRDMSHVEAADYNDSLPFSSRYPVMTAKTIETNYFSPLKQFFREIAAEQDFRNPLADVSIRISESAGDSVQRQPFTAAELNRWFVEAASAFEADKRWLPVLGAITGARLGELIFLQGKDVTRMEADDGTAYWVLNLMTDLIGDDGEAKKRKLKNKSSRRLIAIHEVFEEIGFINYAQSRQPEEWLFPGAFYHGKARVKNVPGAASKRMNRMLNDVGIHKALESVFHSTRHTAKQIMRLAKVEQRTHDMQTGHAHKSVSDSYGSKTLITEEVEILANIPLPKGLDLTPYVEAERAGKTQQG